MTFADLKTRTIAPDEHLWSDANADPSGDPSILRCLRCGVVAHREHTHDAPACAPVDDR